MIRDIPESVARLVTIREPAAVEKARLRWGVLHPVPSVSGIGHIIGRAITDSGVTVMLRVRMLDGTITRIAPDRAQPIAEPVAGDLSIPPIPLHAVVRCHRLS